MNALNDALAAELSTALAAFDADANVGAIVITGNEKAFAAGADIGAMAEWSYQKVYADNYISSWESVKHTRKPVIAAVAGYALGGFEDREPLAAGGAEGEGSAQPRVRIVTG